MKLEKQLGINQKRLLLIRKGYLNQKDISVFLDVGKQKAARIYYDIKELVEDEDKMVDTLGNKATRLLDYIGLSEEDIRRFALDEEKEMKNVH